MDKARELIEDGWSLVVFPEGTRSPDGHVQRFRHGASRLCLEHGVAAVPIAILGAYQAMPKGRFWPKAGRPTVTLRYGAPLYPIEGETHQDLSLPDGAGGGGAPRRGPLDVVGGAAASGTRARRRRWPVPQGPEWLKRWEGSKPLAGRGETRTWE